ncbi:MAG: DUF4184 family protein [Candidatus Thorarchaeota archaeon]
MPTGVVSHQAPGLLIKVKFPHKFDGTALCISALVPDLNIFLDPFLPFSFRDISHSLLGLLLYNLPLTLILTILFCRYIGPFIARFAKSDHRIYKPLKFFGIDEWNIMKRKKYGKKFLLIASYSALIGGLTHLLLDLPAHGQVELFFPIIMQSPEFLLYSIIDFGPINIGPITIDRNLTVYQLLWIIEDSITFIASLYLLRYIKKHNLIKKWYEPPQY